MSDPYFATVLFDADDHGNWLCIHTQLRGCVLNIFFVWIFIHTCIVNENVTIPQFQQFKNPESFESCASYSRNCFISHSPQREIHVIQLNVKVWQIGSGVQCEQSRLAGWINRSLANPIFLWPNKVLSPPESRKQLPILNGKPLWDFTRLQPIPMVTSFWLILDAEESSCLSSLVELTRKSHQRRFADKICFGSLLRVQLISFNWSILLI